jgi:hypothetical protein
MLTRSDHAERLRDAAASRRAAGAVTLRRRDRRTARAARVARLTRVAAS